MNWPPIQWPDLRWPENVWPSKFWPTESFKDRLAFLRAISADFNQVGAIAPSGPALARLITSEINSRSGPIIELGPGTGVFTQALLDQGVRAQDLTLVETSPEFARILKTRFPAARIVQMDARHLRRQHLFAENSVGAVISGIPLLNISPAKVLVLLRGAFRCIQPGGAFYQFTYGTRCPVPKPCLDRLHLEATCLGRAFKNIPPAAVYRITRSEDFGAER